MDTKIILILYVVLNIYGLSIMYVDKQRARKHQWRISEMQIWLVSILGGALGATVGMKLFRHKTKHKNFAILLPTLTVITMIIYIYILLKLS
ncbi:DUF1294 domain-containing protein [Ferdinandcohnia quinoae]|uniref:DUF1294 domain-containing protein n=1 Tax=Fredinandcohnia quinoae TaxID=2918902 RepID=A0AAW5E496_9BACI|nr:DUF1294 domain-containing protein [Fredinandcohnia sp. SECRCQ15]MCH1627308.1 DUF1294 domain-containing protein [Fredinandcohnia sp. SECRCQ15]